VTQVALGAAELSLHNRLVHSLKVEQVGTALVSKLSADYPELRSEMDPYVVGAACLAHDLGHPPFGHAGEQELQRILVCDEHKREMRTLEDRQSDPCTECKLEDSFEGNAQTTRILTVLSVHRNSAFDPVGLDLTRATVMAAAKYPWTRGAAGRKPTKWCAYDCDVEGLNWNFGSTDSDPSLEAQIMDWADDITYAVHDIEDFFRVGLVPIDDYRRGSEQMKNFLQYAQSPVALNRLQPQVVEAFDALTEFFPKSRFNGTTIDMVAVDNLRSFLLTRFIDATTIENGKLCRAVEADQINGLLKQLIWYHIIDDPKLANIQVGQQRVLRDLLDALSKTASDAYGTGAGNGQDEQKLRRLPPGLRRAVDVGLKQASSYTRRQKICRGVVDYVASLSDAEAYGLHAVLRGREVAGHL